MYIIIYFQCFIWVLSDIFVYDLDFMNWLVWNIEFKVWKVLLIWKKLNDTVKSLGNVDIFTWNGMNFMNSYQKKLHEWVVWTSCMNE